MLEGIYWSAFVLLKIFVDSIGINALVWLYAAYNVMFYIMQLESFSLYWVGMIGNIIVKKTTKTSLDWSNIFISFLIIINLYMIYSKIINEWDYICMYDNISMKLS